MILLLQTEFALPQSGTGVSLQSFDLSSLAAWQPLLYVLGVLIILFIIFRLIKTAMKRVYQTSVSFKKAILLITVPKKEKGGQKEEKAATIQEIQEDIAAMETFFSAIGGLKAERSFKSRFVGREDHLSFEIVANKGVIAFYVAIPRHMQKFIEEQLHAQFPYAVIEEVDDYNIFSAQGGVAGAYVKFVRPFYFSIKTYRKLQSDPLNGLTNALSKISATEGAVIQFVVRSAKKEWHKPGPKIAHEMQQGKKLNEAVRKAGGGGILGALGGLFEGFGSKKKDELGSKKPEYRLSSMEEEMVKGLEEKSSKAGLDCDIRIVVSAADQETAKNKLDNILNAFNQFNIYEYGNSFKKVAPRNIKKLISDSIYRDFREKFQVLLNAEEMASLYHPPLPTTETPSILWLTARKAPPPVSLPNEGLVLGRSVYRNIESLVRIKRPDRRRHVYVIGMTGVGKSVLQENMAIQDIRNGEGVCVIDPHGDLVLNILGNIPKERIDDVVYFDPADYERPVSLNLLEFQTPEQKGFVINEMINIFDKLYDLKATGGPMFEQYMRNTMLLMMEDPESGSTLLEISKVLSDPDFRNYKLSKSHNPVVNDFWRKEAEKAGGEAALANMVPYITSKLTPFIANDLMRPIISQQKSSIDFRQVMDNKKILLINLSKGKIGEANASLLGMVIVGKILMSALSRVDQPESERQDFYLYIDEFQNFLTESIGIILSEARKYRLNLTIAHQFIGQLSKNNDTKIRDAVFGNVGTMISFRVGADDAEFLAKQYAPTFNEYDLINIPKFNAYIRLLIDNENPPPFNMMPFPPEQGNPEIREAARQLSRLKYGRDRRVVEAEIQERLAMVESQITKEEAS